MIHEQEGIIFSSDRVPIDRAFPYIFQADMQEKIEETLQQKVREFAVDTNSVIEVVIPRKPWSADRTLIRVADSWVAYMRNETGQSLVLNDDILIFSADRRGNHGLGAFAIQPGVYSKSELKNQQARRFFILFDDIYDKGGTYAALYSFLKQAGKEPIMGVCEKFIRNRGFAQEAFSDSLLEEIYNSPSNIHTDVEARKKALESGLNALNLSIQNLTTPEIIGVQYSVSSGGFDKAIEKLGELAKGRKKITIEEVLNFGKKSPLFPCDGPARRK